MVSDGETSVVIDVGPDFRQQMLSNEIAHVDAVLLTHEHNDHVSGMDDVRPINFRSGRHMPVYGMSRVLNDVRRRFAYAFDEVLDYPGKPRLTLHPIEAEPFMVGSLNVEPIQVNHGPLPILGYRFGAFAYITDAKTIDAGEKEKLRGLDVLIINALRRRQHFSHLTLEEALELIEELSPGSAYLTHLSHDLGTHSELTNELPDGVEVAFDGLKLQAAQ